MAAVASGDGAADSSTATATASPSLTCTDTDSEKLRGQLKELEEAVLPIARLLVPHPDGPKITPLVDRPKEALGCLATYIKNLAKSIPNQVLAYVM
jgi:hypothetical protein